MELNRIAESLEHKSILVTGSTGFLAKIFVEKVLRTQPNVKRLFLLLRAADTSLAEHRMQTEIPGDMVVNALIVAAVAHANQPSQFIYQLGSSIGNPLKLGTFLTYLYIFFSKNPWISKGGKPVKVRRGVLLKSEASFYIFNNEKLEDLIKTMNQNEAEVFYCDPKCVGWKNYFTNIHIPGLAKHVLKQPSKKNM
ncbi:hypothetical protein Syun_016517 [Stephania yunnanensis]|uniref:Fatty acyl-CoA reductase n=1 Tax=Stephania yunnanensis TaxID=152371 RepID=A0AAP0P402_9MAGN